VLDGVDLRLMPGEAVAVIGPSGAGKTSLIRVALGALELAEGTLRRRGRAWGELGEGERRELRTSTGCVHQDLALVEPLRASTNVLQGGLGRRGTLAGLWSLLRPAREDLLEAHRLLEAVGLEQHLFTRVDRLSGGERQRVALARALFQRPSLLLADEPVASVDPARSRALVELLQATARDAGAALLVSLHDVELARACFDRWIGLRDGRVVFDGRPGDEPAGSLEELYRLEDVGA
jgi:phosphonate transport system ATP-binding protein